MQSPAEAEICDTTPVRYFALAGQFDLLARILGGMVKVPRQVLNPDEDPNGIAALLSEIGRSERYWLKRSRDPQSMDYYSRLRAIRDRSAIEVIDLTPDEELAFAQMTLPSYLKPFGKIGPLGSGEAAVIAIAEARAWSAVMDEATGREVLGHRSPGTPVHTTRDLLRRAVSVALVGSVEADLIYRDMRGAGYRGPQDLLP